MKLFPPEIQDFADTVVALQNERHQADYAFRKNLYKMDALTTIDRAEKAIGQLERVEIQHRRGFVAHLLFKHPP